MRLECFGITAIKPSGIRSLWMWMEIFKELFGPDHIAVYPRPAPIYLLVFDEGLRRIFGEYPGDGGLDSHFGRGLCRLLHAFCVQGVQCDFAGKGVTVLCMRLDSNCCDAAALALTSLANTESKWTLRMSRSWVHSAEQKGQICFLLRHSAMHCSQKLCPHGVIMHLSISSKQIGHVNSSISSSMYICAVERDFLRFRPSTTAAMDYKVSKMETEAQTPQCTNGVFSFLRYSVEL